MSELRSFLFSEGPCATDQAHVFDRLDAGFGEAGDPETAKDACAACFRLEDCKNDIGHTALSMAQFGIRTSLVAGMEFESRLPQDNGEKIQQAAAIRAKFLDPQTCLEGVRSLMQTRRRDEFAAALRKGVHLVDTLAAHSAYTSLPPEVSLKAHQILSWTFCFTRDFVQADLLSSWNQASERACFHESAEKYLADVATLHDMRVRDPAWSAILFSTDECREMLDQYGPFVGTDTVKRSFKSADCRERLERAAERVEWVKEQAYNPPPTTRIIRLALCDTLAVRSDEVFKMALERRMEKQMAPANDRVQSERIQLATDYYQDAPYVTKTIIKRYARRTANNTAQGFMDQLESYRSRFVQIEDFATAQLSTTSDISRFVSQFAEQEDGIEKAHKLLDDLVLLGKKYSLKQWQLVDCIQRYTLSTLGIEVKLRRYKENLSMLTPLRYEPSIPNAYLDYCAFRYANDPAVEIKKYYERLALLEHTFHGDEDFDEMVLGNLATRSTKNIVREGFKYKERYHTLREQYLHDDHIEDWMIRVAATNYRSHQYRLTRLRHALQLGYLRLSIDRPVNANSTLTFANATTDGQNPENELIQQENRQEQRIRISGAITALSEPERNALCYIFELDWLIDDPGELIDICGQLGIKPAEFERYVQEVIVPKINTEQLKDIQ